jgi:hypothetical protein
MEAKDGRFGFDFEGLYNEVIVHELITYTIGDGRKVKITFNWDGGTTKIIEAFEAEVVNSLDLQRSGWQAILNNFKNYTEAN